MRVYTIAFLFIMLPLWAVSLPVVGENGRSLLSARARLLPQSQNLWNQNLGHNKVVYDVSGSTNRGAYQIILDRSGEASYIGPEKLFGRMPLVERNMKVPDLAEQMFHDLESSWPFQNEGQRPVGKSVSFGSYSYITYEGMHSPDMDSVVYHNQVARQIVSDFEELRRLLLDK